jgi:hypothetical protein
MGPTRYAELNGLLAELVEHSRTVFGPSFFGAYLVGSFAIGDADLQSDCDFLIILRAPITPEQEQAVRSLWDELPTRTGHWTHHLEGSYAQLDDLADNARLGRDWLFVDHGHREMEWSEHCNREVVRWSLHECGVVLTGPPPRTFVVPVPAELIMASMRAALPTLTEDILAWAPIEVAWTQRYLVTTYCRVLYSMITGAVASKRASLLWAEDHLDPRWRALLQQVRQDRRRDWDLLDPPRPGSLEQTFAFADWYREWASGPSR